MKNKNSKIILLVQLIAVSVLFLVGCGAAQQPPSNLMDMPTPPGGEMRFQGEMDASYTALDVDRDSMYSDRDLEQNPDLTDAKTITAADDSEYVIQSEGTYIISGEARNYTVRVEADKKDKVQLILDDAKITNDDFPVIYVKSADKCFINLSGSNELAVTDEFIADGDIKTDAVIFAKDDLIINGHGKLVIESGQGNGIAAKDDLTITGGEYVITSKKDAIEVNESIAICDGKLTINSEGDGIQSDTYLIIDGGIFDITAEEGLEANYIQINGGTIDIYASDDGINAAEKCDELDVVVEINGGEISVEVGPGDTDGIDSNGVIAVNGGTINVVAESAFDYERGASFNGGTIIINGEEVDEIPQSMMGGFGGPGGRDDKGRDHGPMGYKGV